MFFLPSLSYYPVYGIIKVGLALSWEVIPNVRSGIDHQQGLGCWLMV